MPRTRLDQELVRQGFCGSREQARRLILAGKVLVNDAPATKPGTPLPPDARLRVKETPRYVSRGGLKLEGALRAFGIDVTGLTGLDIGASTGGFTDCLLQHGAGKVFAFDVGTNQLAWKLRSDPRVIAREQVNARYLKPDAIPQPADILVADLSFISLTLVLPAVLDLLKPGGQAVVLIKPQFELAPEDIGPGGIVRDPAARARACQRVRDFVETRGDLEWRGLMPSLITGADGNQEFLAWIGKRLDPPS